MDVPATTLAAFHGDDALSIMGEVRDELARLLGLLGVFPDHRAHRDMEHQVLAASPMHLRSLAMGAARSLEVMLEAEVYER